MTDRLISGLSHYYNCFLRVVLFGSWGKIIWLHVCSCYFHDKLYYVISSTEQQSSIAGIMWYIGKTPSPHPCTSGHLTDGSIKWKIYTLVGGKGVGYTWRVASDDNNSYPNIIQHSAGKLGTESDEAWRIPLRWGVLRETITGRRRR